MNIAGVLPEPSGGPVDRVASLPIAGAERIVSLDILRGFAVLGILVMNIQSYSMVGAAYSNPDAFGDLNGANYAVWYLSHLFADLKFMALFSMLFGAGIAVMATRREQRGLKSTGFHYRRIFWLLIIGLIHAYGIWYGDILVVYSLTAIFVFWAKRFSPRWLIILAIVMIGVASAISFASGLTMPYWPEEQKLEFAKEWAPDSETIAAEIAIYQGSWRGQLTHRVPLAFIFHTLLFGIFFFWRAGGLMLLGMALFKMKILDASRSKSFYTALAVGGFVIGLPIIAYGIHQNNVHNWDVEYSFFLGSQFNYWGSLFVALGYIGWIMLACKTESLRWFMARLAPVGQMALTNYLSHSVICTLIFYGHGIGKFSTFSRVQQIVLVFVIFIAQILFSNWWLSRFRFGPMEWLWRSLTYWKLQPLRRQVTDG